MQPEIVEKPGFQIVGMQYRGGDEKEKCRNLWQTFKARSEEVLPYAAKPVQAFGVLSNYDLETFTVEHTAGLEMAESFHLPEKMLSLDIPDQAYAVFESTFPEMMNTFETFENWVKTSDFQRSNGPEIIRFDQSFDVNFDHEDPEYTIFLHIPVIKKD